LSYLTLKGGMVTPSVGNAVRLLNIYDSVSVR